MEPYAVTTVNHFPGGSDAGFLSRSTRPMSVKPEHLVLSGECPVFTSSLVFRVSTRNHPIVLFSEKPHESMS